MEEASSKVREDHREESLSLNASSTEQGERTSSDSLCRFRLFALCVALSTSEKREDSDSFFSFLETCNVSGRRSIACRFRKLCIENQLDGSHSSRHFIPRSRWVATRGMKSGSIAYKAHLLYHPLVLGEIVCDPFELEVKLNPDVSIPAIDSFKTRHGTDRFLGSGVPGDSDQAAADAPELRRGRDGYKHQLWTDGYPL